MSAMLAVAHSKPTCHDCRQLLSENCTIIYSRVLCYKPPHSTILRASSLTKSQRFAVS